MNIKPFSKFDLILIFFAGFLLSISFTYFKELKSTKLQKTLLIPTEKPTIKPTQVPAQAKEVIGFLPSWVVAKKAKIYPSKLTQIIYFGLAVTERGDLVKYRSNKTQVAEWAYFNSEELLRIRKEASSSGTKILLALKNFDNESIDALISNPAAVDRLSGQVENLINEYKLDGINIDFEYVTKTDFPTAKFFNRFLETFIANLKEKNHSLIVSVDLNATGVIKDPAYDLVKIGELADQVILMGYDFHRANSYNAGPVAPIEDEILELSIKRAVDSLRGRIPFDKLILGIPFYGYEWQTINANYKSIAVANTGALATWGRVKDLIANRSNLQINWEEKAKSPWIVYRQSGAIKQIYYENEKSLSAKLDFVKQNELSGIAIWALGYEGNYKEPWKTIENHLNK
jgi:spore germination protein YaaH